MRWPWHARRQIVEQRKEAEARAGQVHREVVQPLRRMRARNHLAGAIAADIRQQLRGGEQ